MGYMQSKEINYVQSQTKQIEEQLAADKQKGAQEMRLLLLGPSNSGKSTLLKQMRILHLHGFSDDELLMRRVSIYGNLVDSVCNVLDGMEKLEIDFSNPSRQLDAKMIKKAKYIMVGNRPLNDDIANAIARLSNDPDFKRTLEQQFNFKLMDCSKYFIASQERIRDRNYIPTYQDILNSRAPTTGVIEVNIEIKQLTFKVIDVGGQQSERRKWIHVFDNVTSILFIVAISEYDMMLDEDDKMNRLHDALSLFHEICKSKWFVKASIILFLNKNDIFKEKIKSHDIRICFPAYDGKNTAEEVTKFIRAKFQRRWDAYRQGKEMYVHLTCATDTKGIQFVMDAAIDTVITSHLKNWGLF